MRYRIALVAVLCLVVVASLVVAQDRARGTKTDALRMTDGTVHLGRLASFDGTTFVFEGGGGPLKLKRAQVAALFIGSEAGAPEPIATEEEEEATPTGRPEGDPSRERAADIGVTSIWNSPEWGAMHLVQKGRRVYGTYEFQSGQIDGYIDGDKILFWWWENTEAGKPWGQADEGDRGDGAFTIVQGGGALEGGYRYDTEFTAGGKPRNAWNATKGEGLPAGFRYTPPTFAIPDHALNW